MHKEFTASVYILENQKVLLIFHQKLQKWLPAGGHVEANETPVEAAKREALEETGLEIEFIKQENIWIKQWNASSIERPYLCLLENIPAYKNHPEHQHVDFIYLAKPIYPENWLIPKECRWFTIEELNTLQPDKEIFQETLELLNHLFSRVESIESCM